MGLKGGAGETGRDHRTSGTVWEGRRDRVKAPYAEEGELLGAVPEYAGTRGILAEAGGTTLQG